MWLNVPTYMHMNVYRLQILAITGGVIVTVTDDFLFIFIFVLLKKPSMYSMCKLKNAVSLD